MKRKIIQIADSTQLVSLPRKWSLKYNIKKGDEVEVEEQGNKLLVSTEKGVELKSIEIDVTELDRTTILYYLQSLLQGDSFQLINLRFNRKHLPIFRFSGFSRIEKVFYLF